MNSIRYLFFDAHISAATNVLAASEGFHCSQTLRLSQGAFIHVTNGFGDLFYAQITHIHKNKVNIQVLKEVHHDNLINKQVHLVVSPLKQPSRLELLIEKVTEIGVASISIVNCKNTVVKRCHLERLQKIAIAAIKQSHQVYLPAIAYYHSLNDFLLKISHVPASILIAHCFNSVQKSRIAEVVSANNATRDYYVFIGPEGDFTQTEIKRVTSLNPKVQQITLGLTKLRTETAAIAACYGLINF